MIKIMEYITMVSVTTLLVLSCIMLSIMIYKMLTDKF